MIKMLPRIRPSMPNFKKIDILVSDIKIILKDDRRITKALPKSGSNIINSIIRKIILNMGRRPFLVFCISCLFLAAYLLINRIRLNLANSLGWIPKLPIPNQLREPFLIWPIPGIRTILKRIILKNKRAFR